MTYAEWLDGCCSCHINPPCSWCTSSTYYMCDRCGDEFHEYCPETSEEAIELGFVYSEEAEDYVPDPPLCSKCLSDHSLECYYNNKRDEAVNKHLTRCYTLGDALDLLYNPSLKEAVLSELDKLGNPPGVEVFINNLLSPELASIVINGLNGR